MLTVVPGDGSGHEGGKDSSSLIDEIVREGARRMLAEALQAEVDAYIAAHAAERDENGRRLVVRNGYHQPREVLTSAGAVEVTVPRVNDKRTDPDTGERKRFSSAILPPWARKTPKITEVLPLLYLHGLSSGDFVPALGQFLGSSAGLSAAVITRLTETWRAEQRAFAARDLSGVDYVYLWADGIHVNIRLEEHKLCLLVMIGVRADGRKELIALADGYRESAESWADLLRDCARRGHARARPGRRRRGAGVLERAARGVPAGQGGPLLVPQDRERAGRAAEVRAPGGEEGPGGDLGRRGQAACPRRGEGLRVPPTARSSPRPPRRSPTMRRSCWRSSTTRAEHWVHLRTTNPIESTFATVRHRTKITKGPGSRAAGLAMAFKLIESAQDRWRAVNAPHLVALVRAGATFINGKLIERPGENAEPEAA